MGRIASVDSEISLIDLLGSDCRKLQEKESKQKRTNPVHIISPAASTTIRCRGISWMQSRTALFRIGNTRFSPLRARTWIEATEERRGWKSRQDRNHAKRMWASSVWLT